MKQISAKDDIEQNAMQWLLRLQSPELTDAEEQAFFAWLEISAEHQQAYIDAEAYWQQLGSLKDYPVSNNEALANSAGVDHESVDQESINSPLATVTAITELKSAGLSPELKQGHESRQESRRWYPHAIAASVILLAGWLLFQFSVGLGHGSETYRSGIGEQRQINLSDGSSVILNTNSQIRVEAMSPSKPRLVYLDFGEVLFSVKSDPDWPFTVNTKNGAVRVLGTQFSVRADSTDTVVTVVEGKVALADSLIDNSATAPFNPYTTLIADQQLSIAQAAQGVSPDKVDAKSLTFWKEGRLVYNGVVLSQVVKDLSRYFDGEIILGDGVLGTKKVVAVIELQDKISTMAAIESAFNVVAVNRTDLLTVLYSKEK